MERKAPREPLGRRLLNQTTTWQKVVLAVGAIAGLVTSVAGVVALVLPMVGGSSAGGALGSTAPTDAVTISSQTAATDRFVRELLDAAAAPRPVALDHHLMGQSVASDVLLYYNCGSTGSCAMTRVQVVDTYGMSTMPGGIWVRGCFSVTRDGLGYGADPLDIELRKVGDTCPA
jgi:hypothetical protein